jgi:hypothetical protein
MMVYHEPRAVNIGQIDAGREELVGGAHPNKKTKTATICQMVMRTHVF